MKPKTGPALVAAAALALILPLPGGGSLVPSTLESHPVVVLDAALILQQANAGRFDLDLAGLPYTFEVEPYPFARGAVIGLDGQALGRVTETVTFTGTANGIPAVVAATRAGVFLAVFGDNALFVEPLWMTQPGADPSLHRILLWSQNPPVLPDHPDPPAVQASTNPVFDATELAVPRDRTVRFLIESDAAFFDLFSFGNQCSLCWVEVQQAVMLIADHNFRRDAGIRFSITSQFACQTVAVCPYVVTGAANDMSLWHDGFAARWEGVAGEPAHELGHLIIATDLPGGLGIASLGSVATSGGYALSEFPTNTNQLAAYATPTHEIGHNFNATHSRAAPVPPLLNAAPSQAQGQVWTVMRPEHPLRFQFSDGSLNPALDNLHRIQAIAAQRLPP